MSYLVYVRREVILSAGSIGSPQLLMLSGIGPRKHLREIGVRFVQRVNLDYKITQSQLPYQVPCISDLPVGENLQDHIYSGGLHFAIDHPTTYSSERTFNAANVALYLTTGTGM